MEFSKPPGATFAAPRRVFTAPVHPTAPQHASSSQSASSLVDTIYDHPAVKILAFTAGPPWVPPSSRSANAPPEVEPGSLPWFSQTERTIANGPFRIYRAPGSVAFLSCGSALQPILPKSQAWCVDETSSKYVLQIRRPQYWRIELPLKSDEDVRRAHLLREVFDKVLQFEKTECPFNRTFTVELPEQPQTPVKKRPWTPVRRFQTSLPPTPVTPIEMAHLQKREEKYEPASSLDGPESTYDSEGSSFGITPRPESPEAKELVSKDTGNLEDNEDFAGLRHGEGEASPKTGAESLSLPKPPKLDGFRATRSVTAPPQLTLVASPPSKQKQWEPAGIHMEAPRPRSPTESQDSFPSPQSFPPSPPMSDFGSLVDQDRRAGDSILPEESFSEQETPSSTEVPAPTRTWSVSTAESQRSEGNSSVKATPSTPDVDCLASHSVTIPEDTVPPISPVFEEQILVTSVSSPNLSRSSSVVARRPQIRHRATTSSSISPSRRMLSPLPPAVNLFSPHQIHVSTATANASKLAVVRRLPMAVIQKTCEILMSPPSHLINLMLKVAARIAAGEWRGFLSGTDDHGEWIPVQWDWSDEEDNTTDSYNSHGQRAADDEDDWPLTRGRKMRLPGSFPESDDEEFQTLPGAEQPVSENTPGDIYIDEHTGVPTEPAPPPSPGPPADVDPAQQQQSDWSQSWGVD
ncbi:inheritance of peroxisomes protein 1-domain-containing protein [Lasiosphaeria ovina]|uniref:Inheritance of peroxisomes protein 1 n=1 Tax=Lasiosphaeria ovina TaxID=92902 RepID=A0AAE0KH29_9PEZI|nr:inheritance of peroxisomes protein 1-domain-containing protein [Lasiosphaeria ovina]